MSANPSNGCGQLRRERETNVHLGEVQVNTGIPGAPKAKFDGGTYVTKTKEEVPFTDKVEDSYVEDRRASSDRKDYAGGAAVGGAAGGLAGAGVGGATGAGIGAVVGGIIGSIVPGPGTALGLAVGAAIGGGIGAAAGGASGGGAGAGIGAGAVHHAKTKNRKKGKN